MNKPRLSAYLHSRYFRERKTGAYGLIVVDDNGQPIHKGQGIEIKISQTGLLVLGLEDLAFWCLTHNQPVALHTNNRGLTGTFLQARQGKFGKRLSESTLAALRYAMNAKDLITVQLVAGGNKGWMFEAYDIADSYAAKVFKIAKGGPFYAETNDLWNPDEFHEQRKKVA